MKRKSGYYWVKADGEWMAAHYYEGNEWFTTGYDGVVRDEVFEEIDERRIEREREPAAHKLGYTPDQL